MQEKFQNGHDGSVDLTFLSTSGIKLEIGIGNNPQPGHLHCDITYRPGVDCICDTRQLPFADGAASHIYCRHLLEHLGKESAERAIMEWYRVLQPGGMLDINVPDLATHCLQLSRPGVSRYLLRTYYIAVSNRDHALYSIFGWQEDRFQFHYWGYTVDDLRKMLAIVGFCEIARINDGMFCNIRLLAKKVRGTVVYRDDRPVLVKLRSAWNRLLAAAVARLSF